MRNNEVTKIMKQQRSSKGRIEKELTGPEALQNVSGFLYTGNVCILRSLTDSDAFQSGRYAEHNGHPETLILIN